MKNINFWIEGNTINFPFIPNRPLTRDQILERSVLPKIVPTDMLKKAKCFWEEARARDPEAYDGRLASLRGIELGGDGTLTLSFSETSYSLYIISRSTILPKGWMRADPIGVTGIPITSDGYVLVTRRSSCASANPNGLYFCGGLVEIFDTDLQQQNINLFDQMIREFDEELPFLIDMRSAKGVQLLGIDYDPIMPHPEAFFILPLRLTALELQQRLVGSCSPELQEMSIKHISTIYQNATLPVGGEMSITWSYVAGCRLLSLHRGAVAWLG